MPRSLQGTAQLYVGVWSALLIATGLAFALDAGWLIAGYVLVGIGAWLAAVTFILGFIGIATAQPWSTGELPIIELEEIELDENPHYGPGNPDWEHDFERDRREP